MEEEAPNQKNKKNPSQPKPNGLKTKAIKWKKKPQIKKQKKSIIALTRRAETKGNKMDKEAPNQKTKKIYHSLNPTDLNQRQ